MFHELFVTDIFLGNRGIYKPALFDLMARASKDPQGNVQNDTNTLRPIAGSPWRAGSHSVSRKSGRWIYQHAVSSGSWKPGPLGQVKGRLFCR
jgi:hypothetical protein